MKQLQLLPKKENALFRRHPWIFSGALKKTKSSPQEGELVQVFSDAGDYMATGHYQIGSIAVRILSFDQEEIDLSFYTRRLQAALDLRIQLQLWDKPEHSMLRLVHGEGDFLPGLIIDLYHTTAVVQFHSVGMYLDRNMIYEALKQVLGIRLEAIYCKSAHTLPFKADLGAEDEFVFGNSNDTIAQEYGLSFRIDWIQGQKTGFFIDQRENRRLVEFYAHNKRVLNLFGFTGGFSLYALRGGAKEVHTVDSSERAIQLSLENVALNFPDETRHTAYQTDAFDFLNGMDQAYDLIILDPPAFAKHQKALHNALIAYKRINAKAIRNLSAGGILFTFSCSQAVSKEEFRKSVFAAAAQSGREVQILHQLGQPADHPISMYHPEGEYLKGLVLRIL